jgi:hypothetical protein
MATTAPATKKSTKGRKSAAIALAIVGVAGLSLASAAQLTVNSSTLGAGTSVVASCDDSITVGYSTTYNTTKNVYETNGLNLSGVNVAACNGLKYSVQLTQGGPSVAGSPAVSVITGSQVTGGTLSVTTLGTDAAGTATISVPAADASIVTGVAIVIYS